MIPSGSIGLDHAWALAAIPEAVVKLRSGIERKDHFSHHAIAEAQSWGGIAAFIDAEHAFDRTMHSNWVSMLKPAYFPAHNGKQALEVADHLIRSGAVDIVL